MHLATLAFCTLSLALGACSRVPAPATAPSAPSAPRSAVAAAPAPTPASDAPAPDAPAPSATAARGPVRLALSGEGLDFVSERGGSVRHLVFDAPAAQVIDAVSRTQGRGAPRRGRNEECGAGPLDMATWPEGLTVMAQAGRFVGWSASRPTADTGNGGLATMAGIGVGSTRGELEAAYAADIRKTTLGQEFSAGDVFGLLEGTGQAARITAMWAGASCNFR